LIHEFENDFYGSELSVVIVGYIRDEQSFASLAIHSDINKASITLDRVDKFRKIKSSPFFKPHSTKEKTIDET
jgi:riboflavin kinase